MIALPVWARILIGILNWLVSGAASGGIVYAASQDEAGALVAAACAMLQQLRANPLRVNELSRKDDDE